MIGSYFDELAKDTGKFCYGINDTLKVWKELFAANGLVFGHGRHRDAVGVGEPRLSACLCQEFDHWRYLLSFSAHGV